MTFGLSEFFAPAPAFVGGILMGFVVIYKAILTGDVLGISGITRGVLWKGFAANRVLFLLGLLVAGLVASVASFALEPAPRLALPEMLLRFGLGGFLVGFGTALGNGCTSGHGLTGLARLTKRSWIGVPMFMGSGMLTATLSGLASAIPQSPAAEAAAPSWIRCGQVAGAGVVAMLISAAALAYSVQRNSSWEEGTKAAADAIAGLLFGSALLATGMARPSKVAAFLDLNSGAWDASLAFVMMGALVVTFVFYTFVKPRMVNPLLGGKFCLPPAEKPVDKDLVLGTAIFGVGWGLSSMCPGPFWVLVGARFSEPFLIYAVSLMAGMGAWILLQNSRESEAQASASGAALLKPGVTKTADEESGDTSSTSDLSDDSGSESASSSD